MRVLTMLLLTATAALAEPAAWQPTVWTDESIVEIRTTNEGADPHWFPVWLAVLDGELYVRLGKRAVARIEGNTTAPHVGVRIAGHEFEGIRATAVPDLAGEVAAELADKYWSDVFVRFVPHPLTLRLAPDPPAEPAASAATE